MTDRFTRAVDLVVSHEGGFTDDPRDDGNWTGGKRGQGQLRGTKYGISAASYPGLDIRNLTRDHAVTIYRRDFWDRMGGDALPAGVAYAGFDAAVNCGLGRAIRWVQDAAGTVADGVIGPASRAAIARAARDPEGFILSINTHRLFHYMQLDRLNDTFGRGWASRALEVDRRAVAFAQAETAFPAHDTATT